MWPVESGREFLRTRPELAAWTADGERIRPGGSRVMEPGGKQSGWTAFLDRRFQLERRGSSVATELRAGLVTAGTALLVETLERPLDTWIGGPDPQVGGITYASKFASADFEIDWSRSAAEVHRLIRIGGAWTTFRGKRLKINEARLVDGRVVPTVVQPEGKPAMAFDAWRNGARPTPDELFGDL